MPWHVLKQRSHYRQGTKVNSQPRGEASLCEHFLKVIQYEREREREMEIRDEEQILTPTA